MAIHPNFPTSPHEILEPNERWFPADEQLRDTIYSKLIPPLVAKTREAVKEWRNSNYAGATKTSIALLNWWFNTDHFLNNEDGSQIQFKYYFAQREAVESVIYLNDVLKVKDKYDLFRLDSSNIIKASMFSEEWRRFVIKMATGSGKTKVISLLLAWSYFHKLYETNSTLSQNFLIITPNIIVLDRLRSDFDGLKIFYNDPVLPENGFEGFNWKDDFQLTLHIQDELTLVKKTGNIFLTNIHRVFDSNEKGTSCEDLNTMNHFLGNKPTGATTDSKLDLGDIVRNIDELLIFNDEAHHVHDEKLAWFKSIQDINNKLLQKSSFLSMQIDVTATPKHNNGAIFVQTIADYPLVEAIYQNVVKCPIIPDAASRGKLEEKQSSKYTEKYEDYIHLGYLEWQKSFAEHEKLGKKAIFFIMTDDTKNCDEVANYLENMYPEFKNSVLVIHTKNNGEISESENSRNKKELEKLRKAANEIDSPNSKYKAIVSVLMLKEGWDVQNVTTIVGLRAYSAKSNILPEQTLGRGLRRMYRHTNAKEIVSIVGTEAFMEFISSIKNEGVELEQRPMGGGKANNNPIVIEIDNENTKKDIDKLDINIPVLTPRIFRGYKNLYQLDESEFEFEKIKIKIFSKKEQQEIIFKEITTDDIDHKTILDKKLIPNFRNVIKFFTLTIMKELRLISGYDTLYGKVKNFIKEYLFEKAVDLNDLNIIRNLSELEATKTILETFKKYINDLTILDKGNAEIKDTIKIKNCRPFIAKEQAYLIPQKSPFNKIIGDSHLELEFAAFLETCPDIISYVKNYFAVHFNIDYRNSSGNISNYYPDFIVKKSEKEIFIIETKGLEDLDSPLKIERLKQWCNDINNLQNDVVYNWIFVDQKTFDSNKKKLKYFSDIIKNFKIYK